MGKIILGFSLWSFTLHLFLIMLKADFPGNKQGGEGKYMKKVHPHIDPSVLVFFTPSDLKVGKIIPVFFPTTNAKKSPHFLPKQEADSIPFSLAKLPSLLEFFSFPRDSPQAKAMEETLQGCETDPIKGEIKLCATSLESMLDFLRVVLGHEARFRALATTVQYLRKPASSLLQNYTILDEPKEMVATKMVACHNMPYPYAVFYCHYHESESKVYRVLLGGEYGDRVDAVAVCHMDTSLWSHSHVSFLVLGIKPGSSAVCHFFPADNLVWLPVQEFRGEM
ncbi:hypothetical protein Nepgr_004590 [Nepenthes gracilis]|uniref:BURP domain-containing protein n=1 Tax=Nepenthes gracilis TaxID=150966 RepID=A0AAD3S246_NEPGR|nr:hypothetical protein Nepgr_004590 [Nepenthes gracilis]